MGTPPSEAAQAAEAARAAPAAAPPDGLAALDAALQLQTESYEAFARLLPHASADAGAASGASVEEELRRLQIDPAVFYRDAAGRSTQRLGLRRFSPDDSDPLAGPGPREPGAGDPAALAALLGFEDESPAGADPAGGAEAVGGDVAAALQGLNMPDCDDDFEIRLDAGGETYGGRLGHATPEGLSAKLQVDSLTDDGDEDDFRGQVLADDAAAAEGDGIEPFALDPEFNYDAVQNLSSRMSAPPAPADESAGAAALGPPLADGPAAVFDPAPRAEVVG